MSNWYSLSITLTKDLGGKTPSPGPSSFTVSPQTTGTIELNATGTDKCTVTLVSLKYVKRMYRPCTVDVCLSFSGVLPSQADMTDAFSGAKVNIAAKGDSSSEFNVASGYVVRDFVLEYRKNSGKDSYSPYASLEICSPEYVFENTRYSKVYTGERLKTIVKEAADKFGLGGANVETSLRYLSHKRQDSKGSQSDDELIHPYLVQYNESFYSFARRTANRCGEFLYYENGKLHLGLASSTVKSVTSYKSVALHNRNRALPSDGTASFHRDPITGTVRRMSGGKEVDSSRNAGGTGTGYYNMESVYEEYLKVMNRKGYDPQSKEYAARYSWTRDLFTVIFGSPNFMQAAFTLADQLIFNQLTANSISNLNENSFLNDNFNDKEKAFYKSDISGDAFKGHYDRLQGSGKDATQFAPFSTHPAQNASAEGRDLNTALMSIIRETQERLWDNAVEIDFDTLLQNVCLGDTISLGTDSTYDYIVVEVSGGDEKDGNGLWKEGMKLVAIPDFKIKTTAKDGKTSVTNPPIPPAISEEPLRRSGPQTARVAVCSSEPEWLGRVRIKYWWQNDADKAYSPWIRVCSPIADQGGGSFFQPHVGDEVLLDYENGNIERPYVCGYLYNKDHIPYYGTRAYSTVISNSSGQTIRMTESTDMSKFGGAILPFLNWYRALGGDLKQDYDAAKYLNGTTEILDRYGMYNVKLSSPERKVSIKSPVGSVEISAFTGITLSAPHGDIKINGKNVTISAGNNLTLTSGTNITDKTRVGNWGSGGVGEAMVNELTDYIAGKVLDLSLIRCLVEMFVTPVSGNLSIKSNRFLLLEAGTGKAEIPLDAFKRGRWLESRIKDSSKQSACLSSLVAGIDFLDSAFDDLQKRIVAARVTLLANRALLQADAGDNLTFEAKYLKDNSLFRYENIVDNAQAGGDANDARYNEEGPDAAGDRKDGCDEDDFNQQVANIRTYAAAIYNSAKILMKAGIWDNVPQSGYLPFRKYMQKDQVNNILSQLSYSANELKSNDIQLRDTDSLKQWKRKAVILFVKSIGKDELGWTFPALMEYTDENQDVEVDEGQQAPTKWEHSLAQIAVNDINKGVWGAIKAFFYDNLLGPVMNPLNDFGSWAANDNGRVLLSGKKGRTIAYRDGGFVEESNASFDSIIARCKAITYVPQQDVQQ